MIQKYKKLILNKNNYFFYKTQLHKSQESLNSKI
jgi:hypothetical protein